MSMSAGRLDATAVRAAYRRWAGIYDASFGAVSLAARRRAVARVNAGAGVRVLEVGVGTGLALPMYEPTKRVTGIDLSPEMLARAEARVARLGLTHVEALLERDAEATGLAEGSFDSAVAMFVASVVPHPKRLMAEMRRVVRRGGQIVVINHFSAEGGVRLAVERGLAPFGRALGWHPDFPFEELLNSQERAAARFTPVPPAGLFTLVELQN